MRKPKDKKLCKAVEDFTAQMLDSLADKEAEGYTGWDDEEKRSSLVLIDSIRDDAIATYNQLMGGYIIPDKKRFIDIANRAMMLWYRSVEKKADGMG